MRSNYILVGAYLAATVAANLLVAALGPGVSVVNAFLFIGLDLTARDRLHDAWNGRGLVWRMLCLISAGSLLSWALNAGPIASASLVAFIVANTADALTYHVLGKQRNLVRVNGSNVISAALDSIVFPMLAFGWPLLWWVVLGQFCSKIAGGFVWSLIFHLKRDVDRNT